MTTTDDPRPHLTDARIKANETYKRRQARTAADVLLDIDPRLWDEHTRRTIVETLPRLANIELWEIRALEQLEPTRDTWCDGQLGYGIRCGLPTGHMGVCDPDVTDAQPIDCPACLAERYDMPVTVSHRGCLHDNGDYRA